VSNTTDSFIEEVTEEVRRDRLYGYLRRYGWIGIATVLILVGGAAYTEWRRAQALSAAEAAGDALYAAAEADTAAARAEALAALDVSGPAAAPTLMFEAASLAEAGETEAAATKLAELADDPGHPRVWRDLAALKRVILLGPTLAPADRLAILEPLAAPGAPYRVLAVEQQALARLEGGEKDQAMALLQGLLDDQEASLGLRLRAAQLIVALGGHPGGG
jgi:hypothetical protein